MASGFGSGFCDGCGFGGGEMMSGRAILSVIYSLFQITLGLLLHPYQTMQSLVRDKVFVWMTLLPTLVLGVVTLLWKLVLVPVVGVFFSCSVGVCGFLPFVSNVLTFFCVYWQVVLIYLLYRFGGVEG